MTQGIREAAKVVAERCVLVHVTLPRAYIDRTDPFGEIRALAETAGAVVSGELIQKRQKPSGKTYLGKGKVLELKALVEMTNSSLVVFDNDLSPAQIRELEERVEVKIIDRSELILDIFANRATTAAAKLQVEIAQLEYTFPRLRAMWDHLGQVTGGAPVGIGTRGPGEQQLEIDRRLVRRRLKQLRAELEVIRGRKQREVEDRNNEHYTVGLVGYTNAGKSTLFNRLTSGGAFAHDQLFATLSTRTEKFDLGSGTDCLLSDTVGFIRDLPHHLVASFRSTLEETIGAQLLIIVVDAADREAEMQIKTVFETLDDIGASSQPRIIAVNKIDQLEDPIASMQWLNRHPDAELISAVTGEGIEELTTRIRAMVLGPKREVTIRLPLSDTRAVAFLEQRTTVVERDYEGSHVEMTVDIGRRQLEQMLARGTKATINGVDATEMTHTLWGDGKALGPAARRESPHERAWALSPKTPLHDDAGGQSDADDPHEHES